MLSWKHASLASAAALVAVHGVAAASVPAAVAAAEHAPSLEPALLEVEVNGVAKEEPVPALRGAGGEIYVRQAMITAWRITLRAPRVIVYEGETYVGLNANEGLTFTLDEETQSLSITTAPELLDKSRIELRSHDTLPMTPSGKGGFLNYELLVEQSAGAPTFAGAFELGVFSRHGFGTSTFTASKNSGETQLTRLDTTWTFDDPVRMRSLRLGDGISRGGVGGSPVRFSGVQFGSNFGVQPGFITLPLPTLEGSAALPSVVDVYVNNSLRGSSKVAPGPFSITDIPVVTGGGDVQLIVRDLLGRESVISQSYYSSPKLLRQGLHEHSSELGFLRRNYARESFDYGALMMSTTHRYGLSSSLTGEAHVEATLETQTAGASGAFLLTNIGLVEASAAISRSDHGIGRKLGFGFERRTRGLSFGGRAELTSKSYRTIGTPNDRPPPATVIQLFAGMPLGFGSIGASYTLRDARNEPDAEIVSANASFRLGQIGSLYVSGRRNVRGERDTGAEAGLVIPLGRQMSANAGIQRQNGRNSMTTDLRKNLPAGEGIGYRVSAASGETERLSGRFSVQTRTGNYDAEASVLNGEWGARAVASGGIALVDNQLFAARRLSQSFGVVRVGNFANVRVYSDNQLVGKTNEKGVAVVPRLRPFDANRVDIELSDLPIDAVVGEQSKIVRPSNRSGVSLNFDVASASSAIIKIVLADGSDAPAGATVSLNGDEEEFVIAPGGEVYLAGLKRHNRVSLSAGGQSCMFDFDFAESDDPQPNLGTFTCRS